LIKRSEVVRAQARAAEILNQAQIVLTGREAASIEVAEFGLSNLEEQGLEIITYVNTDRYCAKELVLFPRQTCPEHKHPPVGDDPGKMETFRCRYGRVFLYVEEASAEPGTESGAELPKRDGLEAGAGETEDQLAQQAQARRRQLISAVIPAGSEAYYTATREIVLNPGEQYTIAPGTLHWFQAGDDGAVVSEFSSTSRDEFDIFTDPRVGRLPVVLEDE
jgi:D-lyxose ketol-isomerase